MIKSIRQLLIAFTALLLASNAAFAQCNLSGSPTTALRDPLIYGAPRTPADAVAPQGQPPPIGDGSVPDGVTPGMMSPPTLIPSVPVTPANDINFPDYQIPYDPATQTPPGTLGPSTWVPPSPSTPGADPGLIHRPRDYIPPPARVGYVGPYGGIEGGAANYRWGGQTSQDFGRYKYDGKRSFDFGQEAWGSTSQDGPYQTRPGALATQDLYGRRMPMRNNGAPIIQTIAPH